MTGSVKPSSSHHSWDPYIAGQAMVAALQLEEGGSVSEEQAASSLRITVGELRRRVTKRRVVSWVDSSGRHRFPVWQFGPGGMLPGIEDCLRILGGSDEWAIMIFFLAQRESTGDFSVLSLLRDGRFAEAKRFAKESVS